MNLKQLEVFRAVMSTGSTIAASGVLQISQSGISRQLSALEAEIGFDLFRREKGRLVATPEAHALHQEVDELSDVLARMKRKTEELGAGLQGSMLIKMAFPHSMTTSVLAPLVKAYLADRDAVAIEILSGPYATIERLVMGRVADFGFVRLPTEDRGFDSIPLISSGMVCAIPRGHEFEAREALTADDIASCDLIRLGRTRANDQEFAERLKSSRVGVRCRVETHSVEASMKLVEEGLGVSVVPAFIGSFLATPSVVLKPISPPIRQKYGVISLPGAPLSRAVMGFIDMLRDKLAREGLETTAIQPP